MPLYDLKKNQYSDELSKEICEIGRLPDLGWCPDIAGKITKKASSETGLAEGTPVIIGAVDAVSEAVSVGVNATWTSYDDVWFYNHYNPGT
jgi:xylulokinase